MLLSEKVRTMLCDQIAHENANEVKYRQMETFFEMLQLHGFSGLFAIQAKGEHGHRQKIIDYLNEKNAKIDYSPVAGFTESLNSIREIVDQFYAVELETTQKLYDIAKMAQEENDFGTVAWLYSFLIPEQNEEEALALDVQAMFYRVMGADGQVYGMALEMLDTKIAERTEVDG